LLQSLFAARMQLPLASYGPVQRPARTLP
jgi:hypothetical protein